MIRFDAADDHVLGVHLDTRRLAHLVSERPLGRTLDLCTGCGVVALLLADRADAVVGTEVVPRAVGFARFNALLNGIGNVEFRVGSFLEPVRGERFACVVANPPYVVSPGLEHVFRDSGLAGDDVSRMLVREVPSLLEPEGEAVLLVSWIERGGGEPVPVESWAAESGHGAAAVGER